MKRLRAGEWTEYDLVSAVMADGTPTTHALDALSFWEGRGEVESHMTGRGKVYDVQGDIAQRKVVREHVADLHEYARPRGMWIGEVYEAIRREAGATTIEELRSIFAGLVDSNQASRRGVGYYILPAQITFKKVEYVDVPEVVELPMPKHIEAIILWYAGVKKDGETEAGPMDEFVVHARVPDDMPPDEIEAYMKNLMDEALSQANYPSVDEIMDNAKGWTIDATFERMAVERPDPLDWRDDGEYFRVREGKLTATAGKVQL